MKQTFLFLLICFTVFALAKSNQSQVQSLKDVDPKAYQDIDRVLNDIEMALDKDLEQKKDQVADMLLFSPSDRIMDDLDIKMGMLKVKMMDRLRTDLETKIVNFSWSRASQEPLTQEEIQRFTQTLLLTWQNSMQIEFEQWKQSVVPAWIQAAHRLWNGKEERINQNAEKVIKEKGGVVPEKTDRVPMLKKRFLSEIADFVMTTVGLALGLIFIAPIAVVLAVAMAPLWVPAGIIYLIVYAFYRISEPSF